MMMKILPRRLLRTYYAPILTASLIIVSHHKPSLSFAFQSAGTNLFRRHKTSSSSTTIIMSSNTGAAAADGEQQQPKKKPIVQYIVLRRDLDWPAGAMAAQAAHASLAAVAQALEKGHEPTKAYISPENLPHMTKYVYGVDTLEELQSVRDKWDQSFPAGEGTGTTSSKDDEVDEVQPTTFHWWVEQPENIPTAFATWPIERTNKVSKVVKNMKLSFF